MPRRQLLVLAFLACVATSLSCAVADSPDMAPGTGGYSAPAQPVARMGLSPAYRPFYDALVDQGDWVLIEPYGWVFRPAVNFDAWRPYQLGWWEPSDVYGWVWNSSDDFGWITDHYGSWFYDVYQGWVWQPGPVWGPAWVAWLSVGNTLGWAPLAPDGYTDFANVPNGVFTYADASQFGVQQSRAQAMFVTQLPDAQAPVTEIFNFERRGDVAFNRGPDLALLQRMGAAVSPAATDEAAVRRVKLPVARPPGEAELLVRTRRLVAAGIREFEARRGNHTATPTPGPVAKPEKAPVPAPAPAPGDSIRARPPERKPALTPGRPRPSVEPRPRPGAQPDSTKG